MSKQRAVSLETEVVKLFGLVQKLRTDLASVQVPSGETPILETAADQIQAITEESEAATNTVMDATEEISEIAAQLQREIKYTGASHIFQDILDRSQSILEACQTHDIIEQRLSRVIRTINLVEGTLNSLVVTVGKNSVTDVETAISGINMQDGDLELSGPCAKGGGLSQREIDALFDEVSVIQIAEKAKARKKKTRPLTFG